LKDNLNISFIVPYYNVEKYIAACLDSLYAQDIPEDDYEVICVDDCSPDNSKKIVVEYQKDHNNIILIEHKENKKQGGARNTGLLNAKGKYVWFVDSDDKIKPSCLKKMLTISNALNLNVLMFNYEKIDSNSDVSLGSYLSYNDSECMSGVQYVNTNFGEKFIYYLGYVWQSIYNREFLIRNNFFFPENLFWEDTVFPPKALLFASRVCSVKETYYQYRENPASVTGIYNRQYRADLIFQFAFNAGVDLLTFSKEIEQKDKRISEILYKKSIWYFNSFTPKLLSALVEQKREFFRLVTNNKTVIEPIYSYITGINYFLIRYPKIGLYVTLIISPLYKLKLYLKKYKVK